MKTMHCRFVYADHWMKHTDKRTGQTTTLCPKLLAQERKKRQRRRQKEEEEERRRIEIARIEAEEKALLLPSTIVIPEYSEFYQSQINYWDDERFEPSTSPPMHCPFSTVCPPIRLTLTPQNS